MVRFAQVGRDIQLIDYHRGTVLAFDKNRTPAVRYRLETHQGWAPLDAREILGYMCAGSQARWRDVTNAVTQQAWYALGTTFRDPLLRTTQTLSASGSLISFKIEVMTELKSLAFLTPSLFEPPPNLQIADVSDH